MSLQSSGTLCPCIDVGFVKRRRRLSPGTADAVEEIPVFGLVSYRNDRVVVMKG
jgi:hypothetical protein